MAILKSNPTLSELLDELEITESRIRFCARRSIRALGKNGDEFRTAESEETWSIEHPTGTMSPDLAYAASMRFTPLLVKKVYFDLVVAGVITKDDAKARIQYAIDSYSKALENRINVSTTDKETDRGTLSRDRDPFSASGQEPSEGAVLSPGQDSGVPPETRPNSGSDGGSTQAASSSPDDSQKP